MNKCSLRALGGSCSTSSAIFQKNRVLISHEIKYSVVSSIEQSDGQIADFLEATTFTHQAGDTWKATGVKAYYPLGVKGDDCRFLAYSETNGCKSPARWYGAKEVEINVSEKCDTNEIVYSGFKGNSNKNEAAVATFSRTQALVSVKIQAKNATIAETSIKINKIGFKDVKTSGTLLLKVNPKRDDAKATHEWIYNAGCTCHFAEMSGYALRDPLSGSGAPTTAKEVGFVEVKGTKSVETLPSEDQDALGLKLTSTGFTLDRLFPAQELETKTLVINYTLGDLTTDVELELHDATGSSPAAKSTWAAGKQYKYEITVNLTEISIDPSSVDAWDATETTTGEYDPAA